MLYVLSCGRDGIFPRQLANWDGRVRLTLTLTGAPVSVSVRMLSIACRLTQNLIQ
jgi:hypothetical protein